MDETVLNKFINQKQQSFITVKTTLKQSQCLFLTSSHSFPCISQENLSALSRPGFRNIDPTFPGIGHPYSHTHTGRLECGLLRMPDERG